MFRPMPRRCSYRRPREYQNAGINSSLSTKNAPALVTEKVFRQQLHKGSENEKSGGDGVHDTDDKETYLRIGAVKRMCCEANSLSGWGSGLVLIRLTSERESRLHIRAAIGE